MDRAPADRRRFQRVGDAEEDVWGASEHGQLRAGTVFPGFFNRSREGLRRALLRGARELQDALKDRPADAEPADDDVGGLRPRETDQRRSFRMRLAETSEQIAIVGEYAIASRREDGGYSHAIDQARSAGFLQVIKTQIYGYPEARKAPARERSGTLGRSGNKIGGRGWL